MAERADTPAAVLKREVAPRRGGLPPAALALARLIGEALGERLWRETLAAVQGDAVATPGGAVDAEAARTFADVGGSEDKTDAKQ